jgi:hypothetical protein
MSEDTPGLLVENELDTENPYTNYTVKDGVRTYRFQGISLSKSSSRVANRPRWVEFELFITPKKQYVLSRIGMSVFYHSKSCSTVSRNNLSKVDGAELAGFYTPCSECRPSRMDVNGVFPELPRYWAQICENAGGVVEALMKKDNFDNWYLTHVARRLLEDAAVYDDSIKEAYEVEYVE